MGSRKNPSEQIQNPTKKTFLFRKYRGISTIEYAFLFIIIVAALLGMSIYFKRAISGRWRGSVDDSFGHGRQYDPLTTEEIEF